MTVRLDNTTASQVNMAIAEERFRQGSSAVGRVLTLVIIADESTHADALRAAAEAAREHPSRILVAISRPGRGPARLDAEINVGGADGLGEVAELRLRGPLSHHVASVVLPLLVPDAPTVVWWPASAPDVPGDDPVGRLAQRRITDAAEASRPIRSLDTRRQGYHAGDTDLAWTRITPWRALLAAALDQPFGPITAISVSAPRSNPSAYLLAAWLQKAIGVPVELHASRGPGITGVHLRSDRGDIAITRPDGRVARMTRPGFPDREAAMQLRDLQALIAEELRRLDPDEIYGETLESLVDLDAFRTHGGSTAPGHAGPEPTLADGTDDDEFGDPDAEVAVAKAAKAAKKRAPRRLDGAAIDGSAAIASTTTPASARGTAKGAP